MTHKTPEDWSRERQEARTATYQTRVAALRAIRDQALANLCAHHVPLTNCADCQPSEVAAPEQPAADDRPETTCASPRCWRPTRDGICDRCRERAAVDDANRELIDRLRANELERARTRPAYDPDPPPPRYFTRADYDPEKVHAAQARRSSR